MQAAFDLSGEKLSLEIVLGDVAERAGVSVQTILRHFGSRESLFDAVSTFARTQVVAERVAPVGDLDAAVQVIFSHYEALVDLLAVATDVYTWKQLRRDRHLDRATAERRVRQMISALLAAPMERD